MTFISVRDLRSGPPRGLPRDVANLQSTLTKLDFARIVVRWAQWTDAGAAHYTVGTLSNGTLQGRPLVVVTVCLYCEKTPKVLTAADWKNPFGVHWTRTSVLEWQYQTSEIDKIRVVVEPDDRLVLDALVGSCVERVSMGKNANNLPKIQNGLLTLGLIIRHLTKQPDVAGVPTPSVSTKWTVSVGHAFAVRVGGHTDPNNKLLACPMINGAECTICASKDCFGCAKVEGKVTLAEGDQIFRFRDEIYPHLVTLDLSVAALPDNSVMTFKPLDVTDIIKALELEKPTDYEPGTLAAAITAFAPLSKAGQLIDWNTLVSAHTVNKTVYMFKKGAMTGWTWGILHHVDEYKFTVRSTALDPKENPISKHGDCGAIWFVLDEAEQRASAVGCHYARTANDSFTKEEDCKLAKGWNYVTAFDNDKVQGVMTITSWKEDDIECDFAQSFGPQAAVEA